MIVFLIVLNITIAAAVLAGRARLEIGHQWTPMHRHGAVLLGLSMLAFDALVLVRGSFAVGALAALGAIVSVGLLLVPAITDAAPAVSEVAEAPVVVAEPDADPLPVGDPAATALDAAIRRIIATERT